MPPRTSSTRSARPARASRRAIGIDDEVGVERLRRLPGVRGHDEGLRQRSHDRHDRHATRSTSPITGASQLRLAVRTAATASATTTPTGRLPASSAVEAEATRRRRPSRRGRRRRGHGRRGRRLADGDLLRGDEPATAHHEHFTLMKQGSRPRSRRPSRTRRQVATLDPARTCEASTTYTATVKGGRRERRTPPATRSPPMSSWTFTTAHRREPAAGPYRHARFDPTWKVGDTISFTGHATDPEQGTLARVGSTWALLIQHCPSNCHSHTVQTLAGVGERLVRRARSRVSVVPRAQLTRDRRRRVERDDDAPARPEDGRPQLRDDSDRAAARRQGISTTTPFTRTVIQGSSNSVSATTPQTLGATTYEFTSWSDGGAQTHNSSRPRRRDAYRDVHASNRRNQAPT